MLNCTFFRILDHTAVSIVRINAMHDIVIEEEEALEQQHAAECPFLQKNFIFVT